MLINYDIGYFNTDMYTVIYILIHTHTSINKACYFKNIDYPFTRFFKLIFSSDSKTKKKDDKSKIVIQFNIKKKKKK